MPLRIILTDHSTVKLPFTTGQLRDALTLQAKDLRASPWGIDVQVMASRSGRIDGELALVDDSDQAGALGYHELNPQGLPYGIVAVKTTMDAGYSPSVTASHELLEMAGDLDATALAEVETTGGFRGVAYELCDPVEADADGYPMIVRGRTLQVSNFVLPAWFNPTMPGPYDYRGLLKSPLSLRPGGYMATFDPQHGWGQKFARDAETGGMSWRAAHTTRIPRRWARGHSTIRAWREAAIAAGAMPRQEVHADETVLAP